MASAELYRFESIPVTKHWAGGRLASILPGVAITIPPGTGELIELIDAGSMSSVVASGEDRGRTLGELYRAEPEVFDHNGESATDLGFPIAIKYIDTAAPLSIQVHPRDEFDAAGALVRRGKSESWLVLAAANGAVVYQGLRPGLGRGEFERALKAGMPEETLNEQPVGVGDFLYNPQGMIHAIGGGLTVLEIQQGCDVTYRLWDFPHGGPPRPMQVEDGLKAADFELAPSQIRHLGHRPGAAELQAEGPYRVVSITAEEATVRELDSARFTILVCVEGSCDITARTDSRLRPAIMKAGDTVLATAGFEKLEVYPSRRCRLIEVRAG